MYSISNPLTKIQATDNSCIINHSCCCCGLVVDIGILEKYDFICCIVNSKLLLLLLTHVSSALLALQLIIVLSTFNCINYLCKPLMLPFLSSYNQRVGCLQWLGSRDGLALGCYQSSPEILIVKQYNWKYEQNSKMLYKYDILYVCVLPYISLYL